MLATLFLAVVLGEPEITVRGSSAKPAIERILKADNLEIDLLSAREIAERMQAIERGAAPQAFWQAYQAHVQAWTAYADALAQARSRSEEPAPAGSEWAIGHARTSVNRTFDKVEAQARRHGVRLPLPRTRF